MLKRNPIIINILYRLIKRIQDQVSPDPPINICNRRLKYDHHVFVSKPRIQSVHHIQEAVPNIEYGIYKAQNYICTRKQNRNGVYIFRINSLPELIKV